MRRVLAVLAFLLAAGSASAQFQFPNYAADPRTCGPYNQGEAYFNTTAVEARVCVGTTWTLGNFANPISGTVGAGTDAAGGSLTIQGGAGTGTAVGGTLTLQVATSGTASGTDVNAYQSVLVATPANGRVNIGGLNVVSPAAATWAGANRATGETDGTGGQLVLAAGRGTGTGNGGAFNIQVAPPSTSSGTTQNGLQNWLAVTGSVGTYTLGQISYSGAPGTSTITTTNRTAGVTDGAASHLGIAAGRGTGAGNGGNASISVAPAGATGTTQNALQSAFVASGVSGVVNVGGITNSTAVAMQTSTFTGVHRAAGVTDGSGNNVTIGTGRGTGTGASGSLTLQISPASATSGTTLNAAQTAALFNQNAFSFGSYNFEGTMGTVSYGSVNRASGIADGAGASVRIEAGRGTGTGASGTVSIRLAPAAASTATTQNTVVDAEVWTAASVADPQTRTATISANNGATWTRGSVSEALTLSTAGATTDTTSNLLPANSIIEAVTLRVTTAITGGAVTTISIGDTTTAARFSAAATGITLGSTRIGLQHYQGSVTTDAAGPVQTAAAKVRITCNGTPTAGAVRIVVFYRQFVAPTS